MKKRIKNINTKMSSKIKDTIKKILVYLKKKYSKINFKKLFKNKRNIIIIAVSILLLISMLTVINIIKNKQEIKMDEVIDEVNYYKTRVKKSDKTISSIYGLKKYKLYETKNDVVLGDLKGKVLFLRSKEMKANIFQARTKIEADKKNPVPLLVQVDLKMSELKHRFFDYLEINYDKQPTSERLSKNNKYKLPITEEVYLNKKQYNATYLDSHGNKYDINYYMDGDYLVCELVKFLDNK